MYFYQYIRLCELRTTLSKDEMCGVVIQKWNIFVKIKKED
jgi:hypothetical protein